MMENWIEPLAVVTALAYVILASYENIWCWLFGIISPALYIFLDIRAKLYAEVWLNIFYIILGIYGWYQWKYDYQQKGAQGQKTIIISWPVKKLLLPIGLAITGGIATGFFFSLYTAASQNYLNSFLVSFSIVTTWMVAKKILENWLFWIVIDGFYILLYANAGYHYTAGLFFLYTIIAVAGYLKWKRTWLNESH